MEDLLRTHYEITAVRCTGMDGYDSHNTRVQTAQEQWVLKQYAPEAGLTVLLEAETALLLLLQKSGLSEFPAPQPDLQQRFLTPLPDKSCLRLLSFLEGTFFAEVEHRSELLYSFGEFLGKMNQAMRDFRHPGVEARRSAWDLQHCLMSRPYLSLIPAPDRGLVAYFFQQWEYQVQPHLYDLRRQVIHGDANDWNVLTRDGKVSGLIDFGDMAYSPVVHELAIALTYALFKKSDPLAAATPLIQGYQAHFPLTEQEIDLLAWLIPVRLCVSVCQSAAKRATAADTAYHSISEQDAWTLLRQWSRLSPRRIQQHFRAAAGLPALPEPDSGKLLQRRTKITGPSLGLSYAQPLHLTSGAFQYLFDAKGDTYLDAYNNIAHIGHAHPQVVEAVSRQMSQLNTNTRYLYDQLAEYGERLLAHFPPHLNRVFFVNSGSEATELALRMAQTLSGKAGILALEHGYHGSTRAGIAASHYKFSGRGGPGPSAAVHCLPIPLLQRKEAIDLTQELANISQTIGAFIAEPVVGCGGQLPLPPGYLAEVYQWVRQQGGVCISDEVQTGFGRLGEPWFWGFEQAAVVPDLVVLGKSMGNGHPLAAVVCSTEVAEGFANGMEFFSSFGGNPVSCAAGLAVLEVLESGAYSVGKIGGQLKRALTQLRAAFPNQIGDIRGEGLFLGVEFVQESASFTPDPQLATFLKEYLRRQYLLTGTDGPYHNVLKIKPPLCFNQENTDVLAQAMWEGLRNYQSL